MGLEGTYLNIIKDTTHNKPTAHIKINGENSKVRNKIRMSTLDTFIQHSFGSSSYGY